MSTDSTHSLNLEQQRKRAKDLLKAARAGEADALARLASVQAGPAALRLADAQRAIARENGFASWPKLVSHAAERDRERFIEAVQANDAAGLRQLLESSAAARKLVNEPLFAFGQRAVNAASGSLPTM